MIKASGSIHLDSLGKSGDHSGFPSKTQSFNHDLFRVSYCANSDLFKSPTNLWGQRTLSDEEYKRQAESMRRFVRGNDEGPTLKRTR